MKNAIHKPRKIALNCFRNVYSKPQSEVCGLLDNVSDSEVHCSLFKSLQRYSTVDEFIKTIRLCISHMGQQS